MASAIQPRKTASGMAVCATVTHAMAQHRLPKTGLRPKDTSRLMIDSL
jgi:hypothetical protein